MSKQEEIREVIDIYTDDSCLYPDKACSALGGGYCTSDEEAYECLMKRLSDLGVLIKVKCPDCEWSQFGEESVGMTPCSSCNSTGYILESLVKE